MRWLRRGIALAVVLIGWVFIAWKNHFHVTAPLVVICLGYLAVIATVANLWRTGAAAVADDDQDDSTWAKPAGALGELEREKRTLLKAIKEAEFDHDMGKLSQRDVDDMMRAYRARAIEVIKAIEGLGSGTVGSTREQIMREVRARIELEARSEKKSNAKAAARSAGKARKQPAKPAAGSVANGAPVPELRDGLVNAAAEAAQDDEALDADSTTTVEPKRDDPAKEATP